MGRLVASQYGVRMATVYIFFDALKLRWRKPCWVTMEIMRAAWRLLKRFRKIWSDGCRQCLLFYVGPIARGQPRCCGDSDDSEQGWEESVGGGGSSGGSAGPKQNSGSGIKDKVWCFACEEICPSQFLLPDSVDADACFSYNADLLISLDVCCFSLLPWNIPTWLMCVHRHSGEFYVGFGVMNSCNSGLRKTWVEVWPRLEVWPLFVSV